MKRTILPVSIALLFSFAFSQEKWTLDSCITYALENNIDIKRHELSISLAEEEVSDNYWAHAPSVSASTTYTVNAGRVLDLTTYDFIENQTLDYASSSVNVNSTLFGGLRKHYALQKSKINLSISKTHLKKVKNDITLAVMKYYIQVLCAKKDLEAAGATLEIVKAQSEIIRQKSENGMTTTADLLMAEGEVLAAENDYHTAEGNLELAVIGLCDLMEIDELNTSMIEDASLEDIDVGGLFVDVTADMIKTLPEMEEAELAVSMAERNLKLSQSYLYPSISLSAGVGSNYSGGRMRQSINDDGTYKYEKFAFSEQLSGNRSAFISLGINIPIFSGFSIKRNIRKAKISLNDAIYAKDKISKELDQDFRVLKIECQNEIGRCRRAELRLKYCMETEREIRERYNVGKTDFITWHTASVELASARYSFTEAKYKCILKGKTLGYLYGQRQEK